GVSHEAVRRRPARQRFRRHPHAEEHRRRLHAGRAELDPWLRPDLAYVGADDRVLRGPGRRRHPPYLQLSPRHPCPRFGRGARGTSPYSAVGPPCLIPASCTLPRRAAPPPPTIPASSSGNPTIRKTARCSVSGST